MHYIPGTPWYSDVSAALELAVAAGHLEPATPIESAHAFRPIVAIAAYLCIEFALIATVLWLS